VGGNTTVAFSVVRGAEDATDAQVLTVTAWVNRDTASAAFQGIMGAVQVGFKHPKRNPTEIQNSRNPTS
jgi:hypothetical protein